MMVRRGAGRVGAALSALLVVSAANACDLEMGGEEPPELSELPLISMNSLKWENLADNLPSLRSVMTTMFQQSPAIAALADTPEGLQVLRYAVTCALPAGDRVKVEDNAGVVSELEGRLGVDPDWPSARPTAHDMECTGGCMAAHLNGLGKQIQISLRDQGCGYGLEPVERFYNFEEGAFAMDLENQIYTCTGTGVQQLCGRADSESVKYRICTKTDPQQRCGQIVECGRCQDICKSWSRQDGYGDCECNGVRVEMQTTYLEDGTPYICEG
jgi:hypothetical protein